MNFIMNKDSEGRMTVSLQHVSGLKNFDGKDKIIVCQDDGAGFVKFTDNAGKMPAITMPYDRITGVFFLTGLEIGRFCNAIYGDSVVPPLYHTTNYVVLRYVTKDGLIRAATFAPLSLTRGLKEFTVALREKVNHIELSAGDEQVNRFVAAVPVATGAPTQAGGKSAGMACPRCGNGNIVIQAITDVRTKHRGCLGWSLWILLAFFTLGLILIIPALTNSKTRSNTHTEAICQNCGNRWRIK